MEHSKDPVSVRIARVNSEIIGNTTKLDNHSLISRETLLDVLQTLYEECSLENLQKYDSNIAKFVEKYKNQIKEIKGIRVNITDFETRNIIGRGHFGEVHLVKEKQTGDLYAMKTLRKFDNDIIHMSYEEERNIMAFSNSQWLTSLQYSFQDSTYLFFIMEYHPGGDLLGLLARHGGTLPESAATFYIAELVLALEDLHKMGYIHRDIKPDNILLDRCGHLKLADFGSAARLNAKGLVTIGPPVGTPDYVAPEVLQCLENKNQKGDNAGYGVACDFWSLGILAYELTIGSTPFGGQNSSSIYAKIMNYNKTLLFPSDVTLSQAYVNFVKSLITEEKSRLTLTQIKNHDLLKNVHLDNLREQVPPFVPKITSLEDTSNFSDVPAKTKYPSIENFKKRTQFSGRNLPFIGFTFTPDCNYSTNYERKCIVKDEVVQGLKNEVQSLRKKLAVNDGCGQEKSSLEKKLEEKERKLESLETLVAKLERDLANSLAENTALKRTLEFERKDRTELEKKALDIIKAAKLKWQTTENNKVEALSLELEQQKEKVSQLTATNGMLNEQLQHALRLGVKNKESLEKVHDLSRRSVVGLESRLEKITNETQGTIADLQKKLTEEIHQKNLLENEITQLKNKENVLQNELKENEKCFDTWKFKISDAKNEIKQLNHTITVLESDVKKISEYKEQIANLQQVLDNNQKVVKDLENRNMVLHMEYKTMESYKNELEEMKKLIEKLQNDKKVVDLETQLLEEREKCQELRKQLQESETIITENQQLKELRSKYWRMEKELDNCKIDKRILERELKDANTEIKDLKEKIENFDKVSEEGRKIHESALLELNSINESITLELMKLKDSYQNLQEKLLDEKHKSDEEKLIINELKEIIKTKDDQLSQLHFEINAVKEERKKLEKDLNKYESDKKAVVNAAKELQKEKSMLYDELDKSKRELEVTNLNLNALREACTLLENQVIEFETIIASYEEEHKRQKDNADKLIQDLCTAKQNIQEAKKVSNEEKSLKLLAETKVKRLTQELECLQTECNTFMDQCREFKQYSSELSDELNIAEEKINDLEVTLKAYQRQIDDLKTENGLIKQESSSYLTQLNKTKETNYKLRSQIVELKNEKIAMTQKLDELERIMHEKNNFYREREMKHDATIKQQIKLIDYLQSKVDESHKKKTLTEVLFGNSKKENHPPATMAMNYKQLESQLTKERETNRHLSEEIYKLKAATAIKSNNATSDKLKLERHKSDILSPKSKAAAQQLVMSPSKQKSELNRQASLQRMHHNIPHRFESRICTKSTKCAGCSELMSLGRSIYVCSECSLNVHTNCVKLIPNSCGLPKQFAKHYKESLEPKSDAPVMPLKDDELVNVEGWIKLPAKTNGWDKRYACLTATVLNIYTEPPKESTSKLIETFILKPQDTHGKVILEPLQSEIGAPIASSDLPFILKIEVAPNTTCWPSKCLIFMTLSAQEKDKWFAALKKVYEDDFSKPKYDHIFTLPEDLEANIIVELTENIKVLGTHKGLYSLYEENLLYIGGLTEVHHISIMGSINVALMIVNKTRQVIFCDLNHLINLTQCAQCTKPKLKYTEVNVNGLCGFHILQASQISKQQIACVATSKQLVILRYDLQMNNFVFVRVLDTAEPTSCMLFTENSLIVGTDKFFEIDLATFEAEEFLDASDVKLRQAEKCYKLKSFPLAILQISKNPKEYLLCFNEFSVFVDEYGSSTRSTEMKSVHLPLAVHFSVPYLYVVQFAAIEIIKITEETCNSNSNDSISNLDSTRLELEKFAFIGSNKKGIYIALNKEIKFVEAKKVMDDDSSTIVSETTENDSDRFSFSSSIVQSLDGHTSDSEATDERQRKVRFSQTEF